MKTSDTIGRHLLVVEFVLAAVGVAAAALLFLADETNSMILVASTMTAVTSIIHCVRVIVIKRVHPPNENNQRSSAGGIRHATAT